MKCIRGTCMFAVIQRNCKICNAGRHGIFRNIRKNNNRSSHRCLYQGLKCAIKEDMVTLIMSQLTTAYCSNKGIRVSTGPTKSS